MKKIILILSAVVLIVSCKKKETVSESTQANVQTPATTVYPSYLPFTIGNYWIFERYDVDTNNVAVFNGAVDSIYVQKDTLINNNNYHKLVTKNIISPYSTNYYNAEGYELLKDSLHYIINNKGQVMFSSQDFNTVFYSYNDTIFHSYFSKIADKDSVIAVPAGSFKTDHFKLSYIYYTYSLSTKLRYRYIGTRYCENVGIITRRNLFFTNQSFITELRLKRYHLN